MDPGEETYREARQMGNSGDAWPLWNDLDVLEQMRWARLEADMVDKIRRDEETNNA